ncbi:MFS transporter [Catellatospora tritici]|uniref:MFS transporter n=1 Tax=Catellatospora tritici TaxID=2851566 RepID=UPI001C2D54FE|nr:MFS transporter [Catellatospora tritici]MBV1856465.1 MFS transporter [Catellatospora tritici]
MTSTEPLAGRKEWIALVALMLPPLLIGMDITVLYFAVPPIAEILQPSSAQQLWIIDIYGFILASTVITMGNIGDLIGRRRLLIIGALVFGAASVMAAYSTSPEMLITARAIQGLAAATQMPSALALVRTLFRDPKQRRSAIATWSIGTAAGLSLGPVISGLLLQNYWWGSIFLINAPVVVILMIVIRLLAPESRRSRDEIGRFDVLSSILSIAGMVSLIWGVKELIINGYELWPAISLGVGIVIAIAFIYRQRHLENPMIDPAMFRYKGFGPALVLSAVAFLCVIGFGLFSMQYLLVVLGLEPLHAALWSLATLPLTGMSAPLAAQIVNKVRPAYVFAASFLMIAVGYVLMTQLTTGHDLALVLVGVALISAGSSSVLALMTDFVVAVGPEDRAGSVAALQKTCQEFGGALGVAFFGSVGAYLFRDGFDPNVLATVPENLRGAVQETLGGAFVIAQSLPPQIGGPVLAAALDSFVDSLNLTAYIGIAVAVLAALFTIAKLRHVSYADQQPDAEDEVVEPAAEPVAS